MTDRIVLNDTARLELRRLFMAQAAAEREVLIYMGAVLDINGVDRDRYESFDDDDGIITLAAPVETAPDREPA